MNWHQTKAEMPQISSYFDIQKVTMAQKSHPSKTVEIAQKMFAVFLTKALQYFGA